MRNKPVDCEQDLSIKSYKLLGYPTMLIIEDKSKEKQGFGLAQAVAYAIANS